MAAGDIVARGLTSVQILWPPAARPWSRGAEPDAVVARIADGERTVLLPGDISSQVERQLVNSRTLLAGLVLKVAHQGAKSYSSPEFLARVSPQVALVSGEGSGSRSLPNPETLTRLRGVGARVFRPELDGAVTVEMKASSLSVRTYVGGGLMK